MTDTPVSLASLMTASKTVSVDFPGYSGFSVNLCYLAREELVKLRKRCVSTKWNKRTHQAEEEMDEDKFAAEFTKACVKNWKGLKLKYLEDLILFQHSNHSQLTSFQRFIGFIAHLLENINKLRH